MMKVLVVAENYPNNEGGKSLMYIHARNKAYLHEGIDLDVLNFTTTKEYVYEGINVKPSNTINIEDYGLFVLHAPNIKHHYPLLKKLIKKNKRVILIFHGHEIVRINRFYPLLYKRESILYKKAIQGIYDSIKLLLWRKIIKKNRQLIFVFVSNSLLSDALVSLKLDSIANTRIINNGVAEAFINRKYDNKCENKEFDYITIRSNIDSSVYCVDLLVKVANENTDKSFLLIGKGSYFDREKKPENIIWINKVMNHDSLCDYIDKCRCAFMPTRRDTQGVMACELATYGIPLITSNLPVCHEMLDEFGNVTYVDNNDITLGSLEDMNTNESENTKFYFENTVGKEIELIQREEYGIIG